MVVALKACPCFVGSSKLELVTFRLASLLVFPKPSIHCVVLGQTSFAAKQVLEVEQRSRLALVALLVELRLFMEPNLAENIFLARFRLALRQSMIFILELSRLILLVVG